MRQLLLFPRWLLFLLIVLTLSPPILRHMSVRAAAPGTVAYCAQQERYGDENVRTADYWRFTTDGGSLTDTVIVERLLDVPVCSRIIVDDQRGAVFYQVGDEQFYLAAADFDFTSSCWSALEDQGLAGQTAGELPQTTFQASIVNTSADAVIDLPFDFLLAPTYIGQFPQLVDTALAPYEGRGFVTEMSVAALLDAQGIDLTGGRINAAAMDQLLAFYIDNLSNWTLAPALGTDFPENPFILPGGRTAYMTFAHADEEGTIELEFTVLREGQLRVRVAVPAAPNRSGANPADVIQGSSNALATKLDLFVGWSGADPGDFAVFLDGQIESYALNRNNEYWFLDLHIGADEYEVLYNRVVHQREACVPGDFLPDWALES